MLAQSILADAGFAPSQPPVLDRPAPRLSPLFAAAAALFRLRQCRFLGIQRLARFPQLRFDRELRFKATRQLIFGGRQRRVARGIVRWLQTFVLQLQLAALCVQPLQRLSDGGQLRPQGFAGRRLTRHLAAGGVRAGLRLAHRLARPLARVEQVGAFRLQVLPRRQGLIQLQPRQL